MKTGFIHGYPNKPGKKRYSYHGLERDCLIQPNPDPFEEFPTGSPLGEWVIARSGRIYTGCWREAKINIYEFLRSSDPYLCPDGVPGNKNMYYFVSVDLVPCRTGTSVGLQWSDGLNCKGSVIYGKYSRIRKSWFNLLWNSYHVLIFKVMNTGWESYYTLWKSIDGEFPGYFPVPQEEILEM